MGRVQTNISTEFETGHFEACTSLSRPDQPNPFDPNDTGGAYNQCNGPYENAGPAGQHHRRRPATRCATTPGDTHPGFDGPGTSTQPDR